MASSSRPRAMQVFRALIGLAFLAALGLVALYLFGIAGKEEATEARAAERSTEGDFQVLGEGFHFALNEGNKTVFEIEGSQQRSDRNGLTYLQDVTIVVDRDEGRYRVKAASAYYDPESHNAKLEGAVELEGPESRTLKAETLDIDGEGEGMVARQGASFTSGSNMSGRSDYLETSMSPERYVLRGGVVLQGSGGGEEPRFRLECDELILNNTKGAGQAIGNVIVETENARLIGQRLYLTLDPESGEPNLLRLMHGINVELNRGDENASDALESGAIVAGVTRMTGTSLQTVLDPRTGDPTSLVLKGLRRTPARFRQELVGGNVRALAATEMHVAFANGTPSNALLQGPVQMRESRQEDGVESNRNASGENAEITFDSKGEIDVFRLRGEVRLTDGRVRATGDEAVFARSLEGFEVTGSPARAFAESGDIEASHLRYAADIDVLQAETDVVATFIEKQGRKPKQRLGFGGGDQPMRVQSEAATFRSGGDLVHFEGNVRAWQGESTLLTETMTGDQARGRVTASGGVRTLWTPPPSPPEDPTPVAVAEEATAAISDADGEDAEEGRKARRPQGRMSVIARQMVYEEGSGYLAYSGNVRVDQEGSSLSCERMNLELDENSKAQKMICQEQVDIDDPLNGMRLKGERAIYDLDNGMVEVFGSPVEMTDRTGTKVAGAHRLDYSFDAGTAYMVSAPNQGVLQGEAAAPGLRGAVYVGPGQDRPGDITVPLSEEERKALEEAAGESPPVSERVPGPTR